MNTQILALRDAGLHLPQAVLPTMSFLLEGMYLRQCCIPAATVFVGREHKKPHYFIVAKGSADVTTDDGIKRVVAGMAFTVPAGHRRAGITFEDSVFITIHRTEETNLASIEDDLVVFDPRSRFGLNNQNLPDLLE